MKNYFLVLSLSVILLAACGDSKVSISYSNSYVKDHVVKIDDTLTLKTDTAKQFSKKTMETGKHTLTVDAGKPVTFEVKDDAILNLAHEEFVIFPIEFSFGNEKEDLIQKLQGTHGVPNLLLIDSFLVGSKSILANTDSTWNKGRIMREVSNTEYSELKKTDSNLLVVNKTWDFGVSEDIPKSVTQYVQKGSREASTYRTKVMDAKLFLLFATISDSYSVKHLRNFK
jgi:hypothetical protein